MDGKVATQCEVWRSIVKSDNRASIISQSSQKASSTTAFSCQIHSFRCPYVPLRRVHHVAVMRFVRECHMRLTRQQRLFVVCDPSIGHLGSQVLIFGYQQLFVQSLDLVSVISYLGRMPHTSKSLFNVDHFPGRSLHETAASRPCPLPTSLTAHNSCILQVALVASYNHDWRYPPSLFSLASHSVAFLAE